MQSIGYWNAKQQEPVFAPPLFKKYLHEIRKPLHIVYHPEKKWLGLVNDGGVTSKPQNPHSLPLIASLPALYPEWLGDRSFLHVHKVRFPYVGGEMARGIASAELVIALAKAGFLGFFGSAGLSLDRLDKELKGLKEALDTKGLSWGINLIHSPNNLAMEEKVIECCLKYGVKRVSASAFMKLTPSIVHYLCKGLSRNSAGHIQRQNYVFAKISRPEVAKFFLSPPPEDILQALLSAGKISQQEAELARFIPIAEDITVESDSGGHTDNRPLNALFPAIIHLRDELAKKYNYPNPVRVGAAGSLGTPEAIAAAFALGAAYVLVGSVHQSSVEAGVSKDVKAMLAQAGIADVAMAACADMFEMGVKVQVLSRGTMMAVRANKLYQYYTKYKSIEEIPEKEKNDIEKNIFRTTLEHIWDQTRQYFNTIEPAQVELANRDPKHKMALIFRWYLGHSSRWPIIGEEDRKLDYQIWCGPAMGAFNSWVKGSFLEAPENRSVQQIALNLLEGAAIITRMHQLRTYGVPVPTNIFEYKPIPLSY